MRLDIVEKLSILSLNSKFQTEKESLLSEIDYSLNQIESLYKEEHEYLSKSIIQMKSTIFNFLANQNTEFSERRKLLSEKRGHIISQMDLTSSKLSKIRDLIEGLKDDVVKRSCYPSEHIIEAITKKLDKCDHLIQSNSSNLSGAKPDWKKLWESELQQIVKEQDLFREQEDKIENEIEDLKYLQTAIVSLGKIVKLKGKRSPMKNLRLGDENNIEDKHSAILQEISLLNANSEARIEAIKRTEYRKKLEKEIMDDDY